ncbi:MAG: hypothetical protein HUK15_04660 [Bacteroidales bacterium]|nr:hypothetical protein [Bacteroidales bacterium]
MENNINIKNLITITIFALALCGIHFLLGRAFPICASEGIFEAHAFLYALTIATMLAMKFIFRKMTQGLFGYAFMAASLVKMALSVVFLIPVIKSDADYRIAYVIQFFVIYFLYLFVEVFLLAKVLRGNS